MYKFVFNLSYLLLLLLLFLLLLILLLLLLLLSYSSREFSYCNLDRIFLIYSSSFIVALEVAFTIFLHF